MHLAVSDRQEPAVRAVERLQLGRVRERRDAVCDHDGRRLRRVVPDCARDHLGRWRRQDEAREGRVGFQLRDADLDQIQVVRRRDRAFAGEAQYLAMRRDAAGRKAPGDECHPLVEVVGGAQVDESPLDGSLAEQHRRHGPLAGQLLDPRRHDAVQAGEAVGCAAPDDLHGAVLWVEAAHGELECAILHHQPAREHGGENGCPADDADPDEHEPLAARPEAGSGEAQREQDPAQHHQEQSTGV